MLSSSSEKFLEPQAFPLVYDLSESRVVHDEPVEDLLDLRLATSQSAGRISGTSTSSIKCHET